MPTPKALEERAAFYAHLMEEVKARIDCVNTVISGRIQFQGRVNEEFCYLQIRMLCEVVAIACLVAHGDIEQTQTSNMEKLWDPNRILNRLQELRPWFFPRRAEEKEPTGDVWHYFLPDPKDYLTREGLISLYGRCGNFTHRGGLGKFLPLHQRIAENGIIVSDAQKIADLLALHVIPITEDLVIMCMLRNPDDAGKVQVAIANRPPEMKIPAD